MKLKNAIKKRSETEIVRSILDGLERMRIGSFNRINNAPVFDKERGHFRKQSKHTPKGISDIIGVLEPWGKYVAIEVKTEAEYNRARNLIKKLAVAEIPITEFSPANKWQEHIIEQYIFIEEKRKKGGIGFFTFGLEHTLEKLKEFSR